MPSLRLLLDHGIFTHSEFAVPAVSAARHTPQLFWADTTHPINIHRFIRKELPNDADYRSQIEALFTVGRLIREGIVEAYDYHEILCERMRDRIRVPVCDALQGCTIHMCEPPIIRSRFRQTINFRDAISKGGKKDKSAGVTLGSANQIACFEWLCDLTEREIDTLLRLAPKLGLTDFEMESFKNIHWFQFLCKRSGSMENSPDIFHLWTAERNGLDAFLTLEKRLPNFVANVRTEKAKPIEIKTEVLRPLDLLKRFGITNPDPVPMETGRFYYAHEILK